MLRRWTAASVFPTLHGGLNDIAPLTDTDLAFTADELDSWFDRVDAGMPAASPFITVGKAGAAPMSASAEAAHYTHGEMITPEAVFTGSASSSTGVAAAKAVPSVPATVKDVAAGPVSFVANPVGRTGVFLRAYSGFSGPALYVEPAHLREIVEFSSRNDPQFVFATQQLAMQFHAGVLDPTSAPTSSAARSALLGVAAQPAAAELRRCFSEYCRAGGVAANAIAAAAPRISVSQCHFVFRVACDGSDSDEPSSSSGGANGGGRHEQDAYFSAQVTVSNVGRSSTHVRLLQTAFGEDGNLTFFPGSDAEEQTRAATAHRSGVDYHASVDHETIKKGESATVLLSLVVKSSAEFGIAEYVACFAVGPPEALVKVFVTAVLVNPHGAVFGVPPPLCCTSVMHSPLGTYRVPVVLATLLAIFASRNGIAAVARTATLVADTPDDVAAVYSAKDALDELGHEPFLTTIRTDELPMQLALLTPTQLLSLVLLWLVELPVPIIPASIASSTDALRFLAESVPSECHGIVLAVIDLCCKAAVASDPPPVSLLMIVIAEAMGTNTSNLLMGKRCTGEQMQAALDATRSTVDHLAKWVAAAVPLYQSKPRANKS
jgi:hypothetical protein